MMKKIIILSCSALLSMSLLAPSLPINSTQMVQAQETVSQPNAELDTVKEGLITTQPINEEQLRQVPEEFLLNYYNEAMADPALADNQAVYTAVYESIANDNPQLNLVVGEDYEAYSRVVEAITGATSWTPEDLRKVESTALLTEYRSAMAASGDVVSSAVESLTPWIEEQILAYDERQAAFEASLQESSSEESESVSEEVPAEGSSTDESAPEESTAEESQPISESVSQPGEETSSQSESTPENEDTTSGEETSESSVEESQPTVDIETVRQGLIDGTPMTETQAASLTPEMLANYISATPQTPEEYTNLFDSLVANQPELFQTQLDEIKNVLINDLHLNADSLLQTMSDSQLLWLNNQVVTENGGANYEQLASIIVNDYQVIQETDTTLRYTSEEIRNLLIGSTPITQEQLDQITDEQLKAVLPEQANQLDAATLYNDLITNYPDVFAAEAARFVEALTVTNQLLDPTSLQENVTTPELLWAEYNVWLEDSQENMQRLSEVLIQDYQVAPAEVASSDESESSETTESDTTSEESTPTEESETTETDESASSEESSEQTAAEVVEENNWRQDLIGNTPIITAQLETFTDEELVQASQTAESPEVSLEALYNQLVSNYPERFQSEITRFQENLTAEGIDTTALSELMTNQELLWAEYQVYLENGTENFEALANQLVEQYGEEIVTEEESEPAADPAALKEELLASTPLTSDQADQLTAEQYEYYAGFVTEGTSITDVYTQIVTDHPELIQPATDAIREELVNQGNVTPESLDQVHDITLIWQVYEVNNQTQTTNIEETNIEVLTQYLVENNNVQVNQEASTETSSEVSSEQSSQESTDPSISASTRSGVEENQGNDPQNGQSTELSPGANASFPDLSSEEESSSVSVEITSSVEENDNLPATGERSSWIYIVLGIVIAIVAVLLIRSGNKKK